MALFFRDDPSYDETRRMTGFDRYRQLLSAYAFRWLLVNMLTTLGMIPLAAGIWLSIASSSIAVLIPASLIGGMIAGPFLAGLFDSIMRGLRDAPGKWQDHYQKSWKQNWKDSLLPGAVQGLLTGVFCFMLYMIWISEAKLRFSTFLFSVLSSLLFLTLVTLWWPQLVLFKQSVGNRMKNIILFVLKYPGKVLKAVFLEAGFYLLFILFAPWTLILIPFFGFWFIFFVAEFLLYDAMDESFRIEEQYVPLEGDPWAVNPIDLQ